MQAWTLTPRPSWETYEPCSWGQPRERKQNETKNQCGNKPETNDIRLRILVQGNAKDHSKSS